MSTPEPTELPSAPVFGRRAEEAGKEKRRSFGLEVQFRERGKTVREDVMLTAYTSMDAGGVLRMMQAKTEMEQANATAFVLATALVDDDGVPSDWQRPKRDEPALTDPDDEDSAPERGEATEEEPEGPLLYEDWDGELVPWEELAFDELREGSSRRRFSFIMASTRYRVELDGLMETSRWLIEQAGGRPTGRPARSQRGPQSTRRSSGGRSR